MVGIVILNYVNWRDTIECVKSIINTTFIDYSIFIVDNNSKNDSITQLTNHFSNKTNIHIFKMEQNRGYAAGNNAGVLKAIELGCESIIIVNPDIVFYEKAIDYLVKVLNDNKEIGVAGPKVYKKDMSLQKYTRKPLTFLRYLSIKRPFSYIMKRTRNDYLKLDYDYDNDLIFEGMVSGCCFAIETDTYKKIGGFDEGTFLFCEEDIIGIKLKDIGKKACVCVGAKVIHKESSSFEERAMANINYSRYISAYYVLLKYVKINKFERMLITLINVGIFILKSIYCEDYRLKVKPLIQEYRYMTKSIIYHRKGN